jgi:hypothetical protein
MSAVIEVGRAFYVVRDAIEASGALTRPRGEYSLMASCPLHTDTNPSLSVTWRHRSQDPGGAVLLHCFSCRADAADITAAIGLSMTDLFDAPSTRTTGPRRHTARPRRTITPRPQQRRAPVKHDWKRVRVYTYTTAAGLPVQQVIRQECRCEAPNEDPIHKRFIQRYRDHSSSRTWVWEKPANYTPVLYRAVALANADPDQWVWLVEGEKDADTATRLGQLATTNAQGAGSFPDELATGLAGRNIAIIIDRDHAGYTRALRLREQLQPHARQIIYLLPATTALNTDLTDHVTTGLWNPDAPFGGLIQTSPAHLAKLQHASAPHTTRPDPIEK